MISMGEIIVVEMIMIMMIVVVVVMIMVIFAFKIFTRLGKDVNEANCKK